MHDRSRQVPHQVDSHPSRSTLVQRKLWIEGRGIGRIEHATAITHANHDIRPVSPEIDLDRTVTATIAVPDDVRHPFVDGLDEVGEGLIVRTQPGRGDPDERSHLAEAVEVGVQTQRSVGRVHPGCTAVELRHDDTPGHARSGELPAP